MEEPPILDASPRNASTFWLWLVSVPAVVFGVTAWYPGRFYPITFGEAMAGIGIGLVLINLFALPALAMWLGARYRAIRYVIGVPLYALAAGAGLWWAFVIWIARSQTGFGP